MAENTKKVIKFYTQNNKHWVGNGFNVHNMISPSPELYPHTNPFILMDYAPPKDFEITSERLGIGEHPHRGFETVTFAFQGQVEHRDSSGGGGIIGPGDIQWMTAGKGVVHEEFHSREFAKTGGTFEMVQLWVNLPKKHKMSEPKYQEITKQSCPVLNPSSNVDIKVIAGKFNGSIGPAQTFSPMNIYEVNAEENNALNFNFNKNTNTAILVLAGELTISDKNYGEKWIILFDQEGETIKINTVTNCKLLVLNGEPINEPIVPYGPFVMNSESEIMQAIKDYQSGYMGRIS